MKHLPELLSFFGIEGPMNDMRLGGAPAKSGWETSLVEGVDGIARRLVVAAQLAGDLVGVLLFIGAGKQGLATTQGEGIR